MSQGILIKGFPSRNVNGTYTLLGDGSVIGTARKWESVDGLYILRYIQLDPEYRPTTDRTFDPNKNYYLYVNDEYVLDQETHDRTDEIADVYYERFDVGRWEITSINRNGIISDNYEYCAKLDDDTIDPYNPGVVWEDSDGVICNGAGVDFWNENSFTTSTSDPVVDEEAGTITTVTTTTNLITGDVYRETNVVRTKEQYIPIDLKRHVDMNLAIDKIYRFKFISDFEVLGYRTTTDDNGVITEVEDQPINAGIFKLEKVCSYFDLITSGIDLYENLYQQVGLKREVYEFDKARLANSAIYKLSDPTDNSVVFYMPQIFVVEADPSVDKYDKVLLSIDLGTVINQDKLAGVTDMLTQVVEKLFGITSTNEDGPIVTLSTYDYIWLSTNQVNKIETDRDNKMKSSTVSFSKLFDLQHTNQIFIENRRLKGMVAHLEEALKQKANNQQ